MNKFVAYLIQWQIFDPHIISITYSGLRNFLSRKRKLARPLQRHLRRIGRTSGTAAVTGAAGMGRPPLKSLSVTSVARNRAIKE